MRLLPPRFRLRTLLIAVAVMAATLGGWRLWERREDCRRQAARFAELESSILDAADIVLTDAVVGSEDYPTPESRAETARALREYAAQLGQVKAVYQRAAWYPWLSVPPDTPRSDPIPIPIY